MNKKHHECCRATCLVSFTGPMAAEEGMKDDPLGRWLGQKQERSLQAAPVGKAGAAQSPVISFSLLVTVSKYGNVRIIARGGFGY